MVTGAVVVTAAVVVLVGGAGGAVAAGGLDFGWEGDAPAPGRATAGGQVAGVDPVVHGAGGHAGELGDLARGQLAGFEQPGIGDVVVVAQVTGGDPVEGLPGAGAVPGVVQRPGQGVVVQAGADVLSICESKHSLQDVYLELINEDVELNARRG